MEDKSIEEQIEAEREAWGGKPEPELHGQNYLDKYVNGEQPGPEEESQLAQGAGGYLEEAKPAEPKPAEPELPPGGLAEAAQSAGAEVKQTEFTTALPEPEEASEIEVVEAEIARASHTTAVISIAPGEDSRVMALLTEASELVNYARSREIDSVDAVKTATNDLVIMKKLKDRIAEKQKEWTAPISEKLDRVKNAFKLILGPLEVANQITREKIMKYRTAEQEKAAAAQKAVALQEEAALLEAKARGDDKPEETPAAVVVPAQPAHYRADLGMTGMAKTWKWEVEDIAKVPAEFMVPDGPKILKAVRTGREIPGIKAWQAESLKVTG